MHSSILSLISKIMVIGLDAWNKVDGEQLLILDRVDTSFITNILNGVDTSFTMDIFVLYRSKTHEFVLTLNSIVLGSRIKTLMGSWSLVFINCLIQRMPYWKVFPLSLLRPWGFGRIGLWSKFNLVLSQPITYPTRNDLKPKSECCLYGDQIPPKEKYWNVFLLPLPRPWRFNL